MEPEDRNGKSLFYMVIYSWVIFSGCIKDITKITISLKKKKKKNECASWMIIISFISLTGERDRKLL